MLFVLLGLLAFSACQKDNPEPAKTWRDVQRVTVKSTTIFDTYYDTAHLHVKITTLSLSEPIEKSYLEGWFPAQDSIRIQLNYEMPAKQTEILSVNAATCNPTSFTCPGIGESYIPHIELEYYYPAERLCDTNQARVICFDLSFHF